MIAFSAYITKSLEQLRVFRKLHHSIYKGSYKVSSISYLNSLPPCSPPLEDISCSSSKKAACLSEE
jgi:hypothetical protein